MEGVYDIPNEQYHASEGFSRSSLMHLKKSPLHFWHECLNPNKPMREAPPVITKVSALEFGNALHTFVLERKLFEQEYIILPKVNRATKAGKEAYAEAKAIADAENKLILSEEALRVIEDMATSIEKHPDAPDLISDAFIEKSIYWKDVDTNILCKVRPDIWHSNMIVDLKTTQSGSERDFMRSIYSFGYHIQAGMIQEALRVSQAIRMNNFLFIAIEKEPPYAVAVYQLDDLAIEQGVYEFKELILTLKNLLEQDKWPSYPSATISLPGYAFKGAI